MHDLDCNGMKWILIFWVTLVGFLGAKQKEKVSGMNDEEPIGQGNPYHICSGGTPERQGFAENNLVLSEHAFASDQPNAVDTKGHASNLVDSKVQTEGLIDSSGSSSTLHDSNLKTVTNSSQHNVDDQVAETDQDQDQDQEQSNESVLVRYDSEEVGLEKRAVVLDVDDVRVEKYLYVYSASTSVPTWGRESDAKVCDKRHYCERDLVVAGDIHGDIVAFLAVIAHWKKQSNNPVLVLLGDFIDRGFYDERVINCLRNLLADNGADVLVIAGNHDIALSYDSTSNKFSSSVEPSEYKDQLNSWILANDLETAKYIGDAQWFIEFIQRQPVAAFVGGVLLTHGGFPRLDGEDVNVLEDRQSDYTWNRLAEYPTRLMDYTSRTSEFGSKDFELFRKQCAKQGIPLSVVVRGHDHVITNLTESKGIRYTCPGPIRRGDFERRIFTINSMCYLHDGELSPFSNITEVSPAVVQIRWESDSSGQKKPKVNVVELRIDKQFIDKEYNRCPVCYRACGPKKCCHSIDPPQADDEQPT